MASTTNILDLNNRIDALEKIFHNVEPIQQQIDELKAWTDSGTKDASGNPIILTDGAAFNAEGLVVTLEPIQSGSGTPSPTNVRPITGLTECVVDVKDEDETTHDTATITFGQTVYGGSVDFKTGSGETTYKSVTVTAFSGKDGSSHNNYYFSVSNAKLPATNTDIVDVSSNMFASGYSYEQMYREDTGGVSITISGLCVVSFGADSEINTLALANAWLAENSLQVVYELATPIELTLSPAELELLKGYNYITTNGTTIDLTYQPDNLKADIMLTVSQLYGSKISIFDGILTGGDTGQVLTKTSDDNYNATWETLPATRTTTRKSEK